MAEIPSIAGALGRMAGKRAARQKLVQATWSAASVTLRSVTRVLHLLFLEVTGFLFLCFAVIFGGATVREYHKYALSGKTYLAAAFTLVFLWFGVTSFWRAKRKGKLRL
jgi:hypothetical protein